jgi:hypothetical protein
MNVTGSAIIRSTQSQAWAFLTNPHEVSRCVPGLESMSILEEGSRFRAVASVGFGNLKVKFTTDVEWLELVVNQTAKLKAHGVAPGSVVDVLAEMRLEGAGPDSTLLTWEADVTIAGTISALASRMMGSVSEKLAKQFFDCVQRNLEP